MYTAFSDDKYTVVWVYKFPSATGRRALSCPFTVEASSVRAHRARRPASRQFGFFDFAYTGWVDLISPHPSGLCGIIRYTWSCHI